VRDVPSAPSPRPGLRERKKLATRTALSEAALRLTVERGLDRVLVEDIAAEVDVSPRTFNNYFASKEDAIVSMVLARLCRLTDTLAERPVTESLWDGLAMAIALEFADDSELTRWREQVRLVRDTPALAAARMAVFTDVERLLAVETARRRGSDPTSTLYPRLMAGAVISAVRVTLDHWLDCDLGTPIAWLLLQAMRILQEGLAAG
jgi:AcrR family transcriptional regulator